MPRTSDDSLFARRSRLLGEVQTGSTRLVSQNTRAGVSTLPVIAQEHVLNWRTSGIQDLSEAQLKSACPIVYMSVCVPLRWFWVKTMVLHRHVVFHSLFILLTLEILSAFANYDIITPIELVLDVLPNTHPLSEVQQNTEVTLQDRPTTYVDSDYFERRFIFVSNYIKCNLFSKFLY